MIQRLWYEWNMEMEFRTNVPSYTALFWLRYKSRFRNHVGFVSVKWRLWDVPIPFCRYTCFVCQVTSARRLCFTEVQVNRAFASEASPGSFSRIQVSSPWGLWTGEPPPWGTHHHKRQKPSEGPDRVVTRGELRLLIFLLQPAKDPTRK